MDLVFSLTPLFIKVGGGGRKFLVTRAGRWQGWTGKGGKGTMTDCQW